ncbi:MAG: hypothetical protein R3F59_36460 [Myxococcota bacterium]
MPHHASGNPQWENATSRGLPAVPPPERADPTEPGDPAPGRGNGSVAAWLGWSPTRWRRGGSR